MEKEVILTKEGLQEIVKNKNEVSDYNTKKSNKTITFKPLPKTEVTKEEIIGEYNEKPDVKKNNVELIDKNKFKKIGIGKIKILNILAFFGILALICIIGLAGLYGYTLYNDGTLISPINMTNNLLCEKQECNVQCTPCGDCNTVLNCGNLTFPKEINLVIKNLTNST